MEDNYERITDTENNGGDNDGSIAAYGMLFQYSRRQQ